MFFTRRTCFFPSIAMSLRSAGMVSTDMSLCLLRQLHLLTCRTLVSIWDRSIHFKPLHIFRVDRHCRGSVLLIEYHLLSCSSCTRGTGMGSVLIRYIDREVEVKCEEDSGTGR